MSQHFLLSAAARSLRLATVARMTDEEARATFKAIRWADNGGEPYCSRCGCVEVSTAKNRPLWRCKGCDHRFSVTAGTIFADRKMAVRDLLLAIAIFCNGAKGISALQLSRDLDCQYKSAFVLAHKLREAMGAPAATQTLKGKVEVDGAYFGGYVKPSNKKENRRDRRLTENQRGKRRVVVVMRERGGNTVAEVFNSEADAVPTIAKRVEIGSTIYADEASVYDQLHARYDTKRIHHGREYANGETRTNLAESFFSRLRRAEIGTHHHISGKYLASYASEMAWRENQRRQPNGTQYAMIASAAMAHPISTKWCGYWQRSMKA